MFSQKIVSIYYLSYFIHYLSFLLLYLISELFSTICRFYILVDSFFKIFLDAITNLKSFVYTFPSFNCKEKFEVTLVLSLRLL